jgi:hypothetical protein
MSPEVGAALANSRKADNADWEAALEKVYEVDGRRDAIFKQIMELPIHSLKAASIVGVCCAMVGAIDHLWAVPAEDLDWENLVVRQLVENMHLGFTGQPLTVPPNRRAKSQDDPILAAIKAEREAYAAYLATDEDQSRIVARDPCPPVGGDAKSVAKRRAHPGHKAWWAEYKEAEAVHENACQKFWAAREAFLQTQPTSVAGLRAFVDHIEGPFTHGHGCQEFWDEQERELILPTLAAAVRGLVA